MKYLTNQYSVLVGKAFALAWKTCGDTSNIPHALLEHYRSVRRSLPVMPGGNHWGNHHGSSYKPFRATQGV